MAAETNIAIIGLGYVGLPLAIEFGKRYRVTGFDTDRQRIAELEAGQDHTLEADLDALAQATSLHETGKGAGLSFSWDTNQLKDCHVYIITVPTPIDEACQPDLRPLLRATETVAGVLKKGDLVIYESTVYPGCTERECVPVLERLSGLRYKTDFQCGYSPERINPGDKVNTLTKIRKITSGSTPEAAERVDALYRSILEQETYRAPSITVAETAKVVENAQRDLNISFMNELALICDRLDIDTNDVIDAAASKWNFVKYRPGLVGGHCISVDPYYLVHRAHELGYTPEVILSGRRLNNHIAKFIADKTLKLLIQRNRKINGAQVLVLGITFKENCPDCRNTKVPAVCTELEAFGCQTDIYDPWADANTVWQEHRRKLLPAINADKPYDALIACVAHEQFKAIDYAAYHERGTVIFDVKGTIDRQLVDARL